MNRYVYSMLEYQQKWKNKYNSSRENVHYQLILNNLEVIMKTNK